MNLKEAFRYQSFLDSLLRAAAESIANKEHCLKVTKMHNRSKVNPEGEDMVEVVEPEGSFFENDRVIDFMIWLVSEKEKLTTAIDKAKASTELDTDAAIATNKYRQIIGKCIREMLRSTASKKTVQGIGYKFNADGNQIDYYYDVNVITEEAYDREKSKKIMREMLSTADRVSSQIDAAIINTQVDYEPVYDVSESFDEVMAEFISEE